MVSRLLVHRIVAFANSVTLRQFPRVLINIPVRTLATAVKPKAQATKAVTAVTGSKVVGAARRGRPPKGVTKKPVAKKPVAKKPVAKKPVAKAKKPLTEEQKAAMKEKKGKALIKELKEKALDPPGYRTVGVFAYFISQRAVKVPMDPKYYEEWKNMSPADKEKLTAEAQEANEKRREAYRAWLKSLTPKQILEAQKARESLRRHGILSKQSAKLPEVEEYIGLKRPGGAHALYFRDRALQMKAAGHTGIINLSELIKEWKALSDAQKQPFIDRADKLMDEYLVRKKQIEESA